MDVWVFRFVLAVGLLLGSSALQAEVVISEFMASNRETLRDGRGEYSDWIELHNRGEAVVNLTGWHLTDDPSDPTQWTFPAVTIEPDEYLLVFASGQAGTVGDELHAGFRLSQNGEYLALIQPDGVTVAHAYAPAYPPQAPDVSYGLPPGSAANAPVSFAMPTPGTANIASTFRQTGPVRFSVAAGLYDTPFELTLMPAHVDATVRYTLDGSVPEEASGLLYTGNLQIVGSTIVRARAFSAGHAPSPPFTRSYLFTDAPMRGREAPSDDQQAALRALPSLSIAMARADLLDPAHGLLENREGRGATWERPASLEWLGGDDRRPDWQVDCALRLYGGTSRSRPKPTYRVLFKEAYSRTKLNHRVFRQADAAASFDTLILRGGNQDPMPLGGLADEFMRRTQRAAGMPAAHGTFAHLYLNGRYQGIYNVTERPDVSFAASYLGGRKEHWDALNGGDPANQSDTSAWSAMLALARGGLESDEAYWRLQGRGPGGQPDPSLPAYLNVENFAGFMLLHYWGQTRDWPGHNWYTARRRTGGTGWVFFSWDVELSLDRPGADITHETGPGGLMYALSKNAGFRQRFGEMAQALCEGQGALSPEASMERWRALVAEVEPAIAAEIARWGDGA